ncbi:predicted protein [Naegleria gruberi]|uniref:Predicted protein n=1 Tax=Naegleria gruberi TaxID=5762 RepID=D2W3K2_NAEGR|nr:uncharacterized protein NAEGRDRAFT_54433 [Naegleria gruberi]EFC36325.1 predicted protein [Naegleria gruberi]|eukprot:XP_002669069.1 predicted protein [Naegleria gruberi strain NEG-M]
MKGSYLHELVQKRSQDVETRLKLIIKHSMTQVSNNCEEYKKLTEDETLQRMPSSRDHKSFQYKDFLPFECHEIRKMCGMTEREFFMSIQESTFSFEFHKDLENKKCFVQSMTKDSKFFIKSVTKMEAKEIRSTIIPSLIKEMKKSRNITIAPIMGLFKIIVNKKTIRFVVTLNFFKPAEDFIEALSFDESKSISYSNDSLNSYKQHQQYSLSVNRNEDLAGNDSNNLSRKSQWLKSHRFSIQVNDLNKLKESWSELY